MKLEGIVFDMDGVLRFGNIVAEHAKELVEFVSKKNIPTMILTNECRYTESTIKKDLLRMSLNIPETWKIYTSAMAARDFILDLAYKDNKTLYAVGVVGELGLKETIYEIEQFKTCRVFENPPKNTDIETSIKILVIGTLSNIDQDLLFKCKKWIDSGAKIITTCPDLYDPGYCSDNFISPCKLIHMLSFKSNPISYYNVGKPNAKLTNVIKNTLNIHNLNKIMFVGDTINTDIQLAIENNMISSYVISSQRGANELKTTLLYPNYIFNNLDELKRKLEYLL